MMTYAEQLKHPKWQRRRLDVLNSHGFRCAKCAASEKTLHVHHKRYVKGRTVWDYADNDLTVLCEDCHESWHEARALIDLLLTFLPPQDISVISAVVGGYVDAMQYAGGEEKAIEEIRAFVPAHIAGVFAAKIFCAAMNTRDRQNFLEVIERFRDCIRPMEMGEK